MSLIPVCRLTTVNFKSISLMKPFVAALHCSSIINNGFERLFISLNYCTSEDVNLRRPLSAQASAILLTDIKVISLLLPL